MKNRSYNSTHSQPNSNLMKNYLFILILIVFSIMSCSTGKNAGSTQNKPEVPVGDNSMNSLDWAGVYKGTLPCADCEGIITEIVLNQNSTFIIGRKYLGKSDVGVGNSGTFTWNKAGNTITLNEAGDDAKHNQYLVGENQLIKLDADGKKIESALADMYVLKKVVSDDRITDKNWKLVELNGEAIPAPKMDGKFPNFNLSKESNLMLGNSGCNGFNGSFEIMEGNRISFSKIASTMMYCADVPYESEYMKVFETADNYSVQGNTLTLNKGRMAALAKFENLEIKN